MPRIYKFIKIRRVVFLLILSAAAAALFFQGGPAGAVMMPDADVVGPVQVTASPDTVFDMAVCVKNRQILYITGTQKPTTIWLASIDPADADIPRRLVSDTSAKSGPALSPDGKFAAYVGTDYDVKGDIYLLDLKAPSPEPVRLTGRDSADGGPCFSADSRRLYFHQTGQGTSNGLFFLNPAAPQKKPVPVDTDGDAMSCAASPDGEKLAFISFRDDPSGNIFILDTGSIDLRQLTVGKAIDMFPSWSDDGKTLYFARIDADTNRDGRITPEDNAVICRVQTDLPDAEPFPVTPYTYTALQPYCADGKLYFLSNYGGPSNCWVLPADGPVVAAPNADKQMAIARRIANRIPFQPHISLLAYYKIIEGFPETPEAGAQAAYAVGEIFEGLNMPASALAAYARITGRFSDIEPQASLALIRKAVIVYDQKTESAARPEIRQKLKDDALNEIAGIADNRTDAVKIEADFESARILSSNAAGAAAMTRAIAYLDRIAENPDAQDHQKARALFLAADIYDKLGISGQSSTTLRRIISDYPQEHRWAARAADRMIDRLLDGLPADDPTARTRQLQEIARQNRDDAPVLAMSALNRIGDLYFDDGQWEVAKTAFRQVIDAYPALSVQTAAARLALAEILYREERFRAALDLYETEIDARPPDDAIYQTARNEYIWKKIASGEFHFRLGEIPTAQNIFKELIDFDHRIIEAHRGYIKCAAAFSDMDRVLSHYRAELAQNPDDPVLLYGVGLCLTYLETSDAIRESEKLIREAIRRNGRIEYFHQTLGYVCEVSETVYGRRNGLELALASYQKAFFLNDPQQNPENASNLALNIGNAFYLLKQYGKALEFYNLRMAYGIAFDVPDTEIVYYKRLGECAFQSGDLDTTIQAFASLRDLIAKRMDPVAASRAFDRLHRYIMDQIIAPAAKQPQLNETADALARMQSENSLRVAELTSDAAAPPSDQWRKYRKQMAAVHARQQELNRISLGLADKLNSAIRAATGQDQIRNPGQHLSLFSRMMADALAFPERLIEMRAEVLDRLGLAHQEAGQWDLAMEAFEGVYAINEKTGKNANLARNRRSVAYCAYERAAQTSGDARMAHLQSAAAGFRQTLDLLDRYGIPDQKKGGSQALLDFSFQVSLDKGSATQAAHGFSLVQEKRLAETFLARIYLEMDHFAYARDQLDKQLRAYPKGKSVSEKDRFGVALLFHRAGLLANGTGDHETAFDNFSRSAEINLEMGNAVSAMTNITNMVSVVGRMDLDIYTGPESVAVIRGFDARTHELIAKDPVIGVSPQALAYHHRMGVFYALKAGLIVNDAANDNDIAGAVSRIKGLQEAYFRFQEGLDTFDRLRPRRTRDHMEIAGMLHLNMAAVALQLHDPAAGSRHFENALSISESGVFPNLKWRALAGLGRINAALEVLETTTLVRAGCAPFEIMHAFADLVIKRIAQGDAEAAFNLAERLAEMERFHRTAYVMLPLDAGERHFYAQIHQRMTRIQDLEDRLAQLSGDAGRLMQERINTENRLVEDRIKDTADIPEALRLFHAKTDRLRWITLMGCALEAETLAAEIADTRLRSGLKTAADDDDDDALKTLALKQDALVKRYRDLAENAFFNRPQDRPADPITFLAPEPIEAMDLMDLLEEDDQMIRIFSTGRPDTPFLVFTVTSDRITGRAVDRHESLSEIITTLGGHGLPYIAFETPAAIRTEKVYPFALSGAHLYRSLANRKPFKSKLLAVPETPATWEISNAYVLRTLSALPEIPDLRFWMNYSDTHTALISGRLAPAATVPTRPGQKSEQFFAVYPESNRRFKITSLAPALPNAGIAVFSRSDIMDPFVVAHVLSIFGCPTLLLSDCSQPPQQWVSAFLNRYPDMSAFDAISALPSAAQDTSPDFHDSLDLIPGGETGPPLFLGYKGMTPEAAAAFADKNFVSYVRTGRTAYDAGNDFTAISMMDNAISVAEEIPKYVQYLPGLFQIGRESAYRSGNIEKALVYAKQLANRLDRVQPDTSAHAEALLRLGLIYARLEDYEQAVPPIETAVEIMSELQTDDVLIRAMTDLGIVLENATRYESALSRFTSAETLSETLGMTELQAAQNLNIGRIYDLRLSRYPEAISFYEKALEIYRQSDNPEKTAETLVNIGRCYRLLGNFTAADRHYQQALVLVGDDPAEPPSLGHLTILMEQANNAWFQGRYEEAFRLQRRVVVAAEAAPWPGLQVMAQNTGGLIWWTLGNYDKAMAELRQALKTAETLQVRRDEISTTLNNIGLVYRDMAQYEDALRMFDHALAIDLEIGSQWAIAYDYRNQGLTRLMLKQPETALPLFEQSHAISSAIGNKINAAKALLGLGGAQTDLNQFAEAENTFVQALDLSRSMMLRETEWRSLFGLAKIKLEFRKDPQAAEQLLREAIDVIEGLRAEMKIDALKESFLENKLSVYEALVLLLADQEREEEAFEIAERSRARNFIDLLGNQPITLGDAAENALFEKIGLLRSEIETIESMLAGATREDEQEAYADRLDTLQNNLNGALADIQALNPELAAMVSVTPVDAASIMKNLSPGAALASYYVTDKEILCWVLTPENPAVTQNAAIHMVRVPADKTTLEQEILVYRRILQNLEPFEKHGRDLYLRLAAPILPRLDGITTLGIIPHGPLHYLSFATLFDGKRFLVDTHALFYLPSASILGYSVAKRTSHDKQKIEVLAVGNPDLGDPILNLPFAEHEVHAIGWNFPAITVLTRERATRDWVVDNIDRFDIVHIASHGEFDPVNPLLSALKLASPREADVLAGHHAGDLSARDIFGLTIKAELVVLSACQTGLGKVSAGDDVVGLNRSFLYAGTHAVISSLWRVSDVSTAMLIKSFYRRYMEQNKAESIRDAMRHVKSRYPHPGYWGAFTLAGDYQ
jgi:CHAT domain-containing protein